MKISYHWLKHFIKTSQKPSVIADHLTAIGLEVTDVSSFQAIPANLILGKILQCELHPNADLLTKVLVDIGQEHPLSIICGAPNVQKGKKVVVAPVGSQLTLPNHRVLTIKKNTIRGEISEGMLCAEDEIGLSDRHEEIILLHTKYAPGTPMETVWKCDPDTIFEIDITPNLNYALSHRGVAIQLAAAMDKKWENPYFSPLIPSDHQPLQLIVKNKKACPRYACVVIQNVQVAPSPIWLQQRLRSIGLKPINNVVDSSNWIMHHLGQPIHIFDYDAIVDKKLIVQCLPAGIPFIGLDQITRQLSGQELMICDTQGPLAMAGIIGGERGKVTPKTKNIVIESAYFDPATIYQTAKNHKINTEAAYRFERGTDPEDVFNVLEASVAILQKYTKGNVASIPQEHYPIPFQRRSIHLQRRSFKEVVGIPISLKEIYPILEKLDFQITQQDQDQFTVTVPSYRSHVKRPIDVVEEWLCIYGYQQIPINPTPTTQLTYTPAPPAHLQRKQIQHISNTLAARGYHQIITNSLTNQQYSTAPPNQKIHITNPLSRQLDSLRDTLLHSGLHVIQHNLNHQEKNIQLFEQGKVYIRIGDQYREQGRLGIWLCGHPNQSNWEKKERAHALHDLHTCFQQLLQLNGHSEPYPYWQQQEHPHYVYSLSWGEQDKTLAILGEVSPILLTSFGITQPVFFGEIAYAALLKKPTKTVQYSPVSRYPLVTRDISLALAANTQFQEIQRIIQKLQLPFLQRIELVDYYKGANPTNYPKAYTIRLVLQAFDHTLTEKEITPLISQVNSALTSHLEAAVRT